MSSWFTEDEQQGVRDVWRVYDALYDEVSRAQAAAFAGHPLAPVFASNVESARGAARELFANAVATGSWSAYEEYLREAAARFAQLGVSFEEWHVLVSVFGDVVRPALVDAYGGDPPRLKAALQAITRFRDRFQLVLAKAFLDAKEQRLRALATRLQGAIEEERTYIAREVHDELGQQLTAMKLDLGWILHRYDSRERASVGERLRAMSRMIDETVQTVRRITTRLRPGILDDLGLAAALEWQARQIEERSGILICLSLPDDDLDLTREQSTALFRSFQEVLTNVMRHAAARTVRVRLEQIDGMLALEIEDDGRGISPSEVSSGMSLGLVGIRERVALLGGTFRIEGTPGCGTRVSLRVPLASKA